jgi:hypothetical protein
VFSGISHQRHHYNPPESSSVAWPMNLASGMIAMAARKNKAVDGSPSFDPTMAMGGETQKEKKKCLHGRASISFERSLSQRRTLLPNGS